MKKFRVLRISIVALIYLALFPLASASGMIHPACFAYVGTLLPLPFAFLYLYAAAHLRRFGVAAILNGFVLVVGLIAGEGNPPFIVGMILLAAVAELVRKLNGYDTLKGVRRSFIPFAFSFYSYSAHWWTDTEGSVSAAAEEMRAGYADQLEAVAGNIPVLILMLVLVVPVAVLGMRLAEKAMKKQTVLLR